MVAQEITLQAPDLVRKLILVGTGPRGGEGMATLTPRRRRIFGATYDPPEHLWLAVLFSPSEAGQAAGTRVPEAQASSPRGSRSRGERQGFARPARSDRQVGRPAGGGSYGYLKSIFKQPTLVVDGSNDVIMLYDQLLHPAAKYPERAARSSYPDSNHGSLYQYPKLFVRHKPRCSWTHDTRRRRGFFTRKLIKKAFGAHSFPRLAHFPPAYVS